jgi:hypothetical protein
MLHHAAVDLRQGNDGRLLLPQQSSCIPQLI